MAFQETLITGQLALVNEALRDGISFHYFGRDTDSGSARIERRDDHGFIALEAVGSERECWLFACGLVAALDVTNRITA